MDNTNFEVSEELKKILKTTNEIARSEGYKEISLELVTYVILKSYIEDGFSESSIIKQVLNSFKPSAKKKMLEICHDAYEKNTRKISWGFKTSSDLTFTEDMEVAIKNSKIYDGIKGIISDRQRKNGIIKLKTLII